MPDLLEVPVACVRLRQARDDTKGPAAHALTAGIGAVFGTVV